MNPAPVRGYVPYLLIWGAQWMVQALLQYFLNAGPQHPAVTAGLWTAAALSAVVFVLQRGRSRRGGGRPAADASGLNPAGAKAAGSPAATATAKKPLQASAFAVPALVLLASAGLLVYAQPPAYLLPELLRGLLLALGYTLLGVWLRRELMLLGLWLWALAAVLAVWFMGFIPLVLLFFGGLSLLACAILFALPARSASA